MLQLSLNLISQAWPKLPLSQNRAKCVTDNTSPTFINRDFMECWGHPWMTKQPHLRWRWRFGPWTAANVSKTFSSISILTRCMNDGFGIEFVRLYRSVPCRSWHRFLIVTTVSRGKVRLSRAIRAGSLRKLPRCIGTHSRSEETAQRQCFDPCWRCKKLGRHLTSKPSRCT